MKIIFSPSKEMDFSESNIFFENKKIEESEKTKLIYEKLIQLSDEEISKKFKISGKMLDDFKYTLKNYDKSIGKTAIESYKGIAFRQLKLNEYTVDNWKYI